VLDWVERRRHTLRWGNGAKYGTANIAPNGSALTVLSVDTTGLIFVFMNNLQQMGAFGPTNDREAFIGRLNNIQGIGIRKDKAAQAFVGFQIRNVDQTDIPSFFDIIDVAMARGS
jgi:hypothetical protein